jgi:hypothetical protein
MMKTINTGILPAEMLFSYLDHHDYHNTNFDPSVKGSLAMADPSLAEVD